MLRYSRKKHGANLWAKIEVLANDFAPLFNNKINK